MASEQLAWDCSCDNTEQLDLRAWPRSDSRQTREGKLNVGIHTLATILDARRAVSIPVPPHNSSHRVDLKSLRTFVGWLNRDNTLRLFSPPLGLFRGLLVIYIKAAPRSQREIADLQTRSTRLCMKRAVLYSARASQSSSFTLSRRCCTAAMTTFDLPWSTDTRKREGPIRLDACRGFAAFSIVRLLLQGFLI